jgi:hypothetical protein
MSHEELIRALRDGRGRLTAIEMVQLIVAHTGKLPTQFALIVLFKRAFPQIPISVLTDAGFWRGLGFGDMSDEDFEATLRPWLGPTAE